jgi:CAAD domains of cyanobacterial aminoacyl-tRNA synthetase
MKNNIIKDDREISMKSESLATDISDKAESITTNNNLPTETFEMNTNTISELPDPTEPVELMIIVDESIANPNELMIIVDEPITNSAEPMTMADETPTDPTEPMMIADEPITDSAHLQSAQTELTTFFEQTKSTATDFFNNNRPLFTTLGWIALVIIGAKFMFAALGTIDDIPLVTPLLKIVGLVSVVRFAWRYLIREHDRQELIEILDRKKVEVLGNRQPLS